MTLMYPALICLWEESLALTTSSAASLAAIYRNKHAKHVIFWLVFSPFCPLLTVGPTAEGRPVTLGHGILERWAWRKRREESAKINCKIDCRRTVTSRRRLNWLTRTGRLGARPSCDKIFYLEFKVMIPLRVLRVFSKSLPMCNWIL